MEKRTQAQKITDHYSDILRLVELGHNISDAIKHFDIHSSVFYKTISPIQKTEIYNAKKLHTTYGQGFFGRYDKNHFDKIR